MSTSDMQHAEPRNSQCDSSSPQARSPNTSPRRNRKKRVRPNSLDITCKVSPFKPRNSFSRTLPLPTLPIFSFQREEDSTSRSLPPPTPSNDDHISAQSAPFSSCVTTPLLRSRQTRLSPNLALKANGLPQVASQPALPSINSSLPCLPADIDVPSPPSSSTSGDNQGEGDVIEAYDLHQVRNPVIVLGQKSAPTQLPSQFHQTPRNPQTDTCEPPEFSQDSAFFSFSNIRDETSGGKENLFRLEQEGTGGDIAKAEKPLEGEAPPRYYTRSFDYIIVQVLRRYQSILPSLDVDVAKIVHHNLSNNAQALFVRIYGRKQPQWFRLSKLVQAYESEIDVPAGINELCKERILISSMYAVKGSSKCSSLLARELLTTLDLSEMRAVCDSVVDGPALRRLPRNRLLPALRKLLSTPNSSKKTKKRLVQTTLSGLRPADCLARAVLKLTGHTLRVPDFVLSSLRRIRSLFFLDDGHDSPNVILADTGKVKFPLYECEPARTIFPSSRALEDYESAIELEKSINESLEAKDWSRAAYFGSMAELEIREFRICENQKRYRLQQSLANDHARRSEHSVETAEKCISSERPSFHKRATWKDEIDQLSHPFLRRYTAQWVHVRSCWHSVHALERICEYRSAVSRLKLLLSTNLIPRRRGKCLARLTINLFKHLGELEEPLEIIVFALGSPGNNLRLGDRIGLAQRGAAIHAKLISKSVHAERPKRFASKPGSDSKDTDGANRGPPHEIVETLKLATSQVSIKKILGKSLNVLSREEKDRISSIADPWIRYKEENRIKGRSEGSGMKLAIMGKSVFKSRYGNGSHVSVEEYCLEWYASQEKLVGIHDEGSSVRFIFTLLLWESALFADIPDVFQTPYQDRPLDLHTEAFYLLRRSRIDDRLKEIMRQSSDEIYEEVDRRYRKFEGTRAVGCTWTSYSSEDIASVAAGLGGPALAHCCGLLAKDYTYWSGGLPDLTLRKNDDDSGDKRFKTKLVEVKSARDTLSERQRAWLVELQSCGVDCEVCKVVEEVTSKNACELGHSTLATADSVSQRRADLNVLKNS